jgi:hypothetical protein
MIGFKDGRPDFSQPVVARLATGLVWGVALALLDPFRPETNLTPDQRVALYTVFWALLTAPFVVLAGLGHMRGRTLAVWTGVAALLAAGLALHDLTRQPVQTWAPHPSGLLVPLTAVFFFVLHQWVAAADEARRWVPPYDGLFGQATRQAVQLVLSVALTGLFWAVLGLGAALFGLIGLKGFGQFIGERWFAFPATTLVFALAVQLSDLRVGLIEGLKTFGLTLLSWLGPLMTGLGLAFLISLPIVGLAPLWATKAATPILLTAAIVLIGLINAAYQDGQRAPPPAAALRLSARVAALLLAPLVGLAAYATALRIGQYGLTPDRVTAVAVIVVAGLAALGYAVAALSPGLWMKRLEATNLAGVVLALATLLALFTPLADPARLSVDSQVGRLTRGLIAPAKFDFQFLEGSGQRYGQAALAALKARKDQIGELARAADEPEPVGPPKPYKVEFRGFPTGTSLPADFLARAWPGGSTDTPSCSQGPCEAFLVDVTGDGRAEVLVRQTDTMPDILVYQRGPGGWQLIGHSTAQEPMSGEVLTVLEAGKAGAASPALRDLVAGGTRIDLAPEEPATPRAPDKPPPQLERRGGRLSPWTNF